MIRSEDTTTSTLQWTTTPLAVDGNRFHSKTQTEEMDQQRDETGQKATRPLGSAASSLISDEHEEEDLVDAMERERRDAQLTCDVLCSLGAAAKSFNHSSDGGTSSSSGSRRHADDQSKRKGGGRTCSKQLQLPMFLSSK